ncbi:DinB family protein [Planococcus lenghuensis]|uniref:DinB-like domain-containing protein n=1 Tax=Planococcus lenghuensis TaxID=2213202 RepID=A0A1Q2KVV8_9BACL|nr:DinB family protein [Planococcus lenghuensis]AQQ52355.1 hypothetical protein B0X71_04000 [Planococcus lenghuensis]
MENRFFQLGLTGRASHVHTGKIAEGLDWRTAGKRPADLTYSVWEVLFHMIYWQDYLLAQLRGESPVRPERAAESWPAEPAPADEAAWNEAVTRFIEGLQTAVTEAEDDLYAIVHKEQMRMEILMSLITHNSYHAGQIVLIRRALGAWPPSSGGDTW